MIALAILGTVCECESWWFCVCVCVCFGGRICKSALVCECPCSLELEGVVVLLTKKERRRLPMQVSWAGMKLTLFVQSSIAILE